MRCHVCLEPFEPYPGHDKLCVICGDEIRAQQARMIGADFFISPAIRRYLAAFDAFLGGDSAAWWEMRWRLADVYDERGVVPPDRLHLPDVASVLMVA